jgi:hypothetical protein
MSFFQIGRHYLFIPFVLLNLASTIIYATENRIEIS